uniref:Uncharacterized protein n=1 Tax=Rhizophora mucronata TaxID=61149 RepID=A0A2P2MZZ3_RHIMU
MFQQPQVCSKSIL